jgi:hypothetical protein
MLSDIARFFDRVPGEPVTQSSPLASYQILFGSKVQPNGVQASLKPPLQLLSFYHKSGRNDKRSAWGGPLHNQEWMRGVRPLVTKTMASFYR